MTPRSARQIRVEIAQVRGSGEGFSGDARVTFGCGLDQAAMAGSAKPVEPPRVTTERSPERDLGARVGSRSQEDKAEWKMGQAKAVSTLFLLHMHHFEL